MSLTLIGLHGDSEVLGSEVIGRDSGVEDDRRVQVSLDRSGVFTLVLEIHKQVHVLTQHDLKRDLVLLDLVYYYYNIIRLLCLLMKRQVCHLFSRDGDGQLSIGHLGVIPLNAVFLRPRHSPVVFCTTWTHKYSSVQTASSRLFQVTCFMCYLQGTCSCA